MYLLFITSCNSDHCISESEIVVREEEPTSIVSFALHSKHYQEEIKRLRSVNIQEMFNSKSDNSDNQANTSVNNAESDAIEYTLIHASGTHIRYGNIYIMCSEF